MRPSWSSPEVTLSPPFRGTDPLLAERFGVALAAQRDPTLWQLFRQNDELQLVAPLAMGGLAIGLELRFGPLQKRLRSARPMDPLARAVGVGRGRTPRVVDALAGLCRDGMTLAHLGCEVTAIERIPALAFLAYDAIAASWLAPRLEVVAADALDWLPRQPHRPEVVYLDPMFEEAGSAQVKKDMQVCRLLAGPPEDAAPLVALARSLATDRVVVKRHRALSPLADGVSFAVEGERVRFDVYLAPGQQPATRGS
jgi:16S rRNA (guanine1516-N2)-methyltransferase